MDVCCDARADESEGLRGGTACSGRGSLCSMASRLRERLGANGKDDNVIEWEIVSSRLKRSQVKPRNNLTSKDKQYYNNLKDLLYYGRLLTRSTGQISRPLATPLP